MQHRSRRWSHFGRLPLVATRPAAGSITHLNTCHTLPVDGGAAPPIVVLAFVFSSTCATYGIPEAAGANHR